MQNHIKLPKVVIVRIDGGLGSQMGQYAFGMAIEKKSRLPVLHDLSWYQVHGKDLLGINNRKFELSALFPKVAVRQAPNEIKQLFFKANRVFSAIEPCTEMILSSREPRFLNGYYTGGNFLNDIADEIHECYHFNMKLSQENGHIFNQIHHAEAAVAVHIRRGDYLVSPIHTVLSAEYYARAMDTMTSMLGGVRPVFFIFSNDFIWSRDAFASSIHTIRYVETNANDDGRYDMFLMSQCDHLIISASTFSFWAAWLARRNTNKIVLRPQYTLGGEKPADYPGWYGLPIEL